MIVDGQPETNGPRRRVRRSLLFAVLCFCFLSFAVSRWVIWPVKISGDSMWPTYDDGQPNYINKLAYAARPPQRGDVVGVRLNGREVYLKRVIGLPGERVEFHRGTVVVNGKPLDEPYVKRPLLWWLSPVKLGPNEFFVMGDNRTFSMLGAVDRETILGKAVF